jgi:hypothetical protein
MLMGNTYTRFIELNHRKRFRMRYITLLLLTILIIPTTFISWKHSAAKELTNDTQTILEQSKSILQGDYSLNVRWSDKGAGYASLIAFQAYFNEISQKLGIQPSGNIDYVNGLPVLHGSSQLAEGAQLQSILAGSKDQKISTWILKLNAAPPMTMEQMVQAQQALKHKLANLGFKGSWNTMVQGSLTNVGIGDHPEAFIHSISESMQGYKQEIYQEDQTVSVSLLSEKMHTSVQSGNHKVNLQIALHQNSITKVWRFTMGSPLITMEY